MPAEFDACVKNGGRVRTKNIEANKYMHVCFLGGKSYAGEVRTKEQMDRESQLLESKGVKMEKDVSVRFNIKEKKVDPEKRTVLAGILEGDSLSDNKRFYPMGVVEKAISTLKGKRSMIGHESQSVEDVIAVIEDSRMEGRVGFGSFRFGTDPKSDMIFSKVKEGLVDSVSIRANGVTSRKKMGEEFVDVVESLDIFSVDWVLEGGVKSAKVVKVFESQPEFKEIKNKENLSMTEEQIKEIQEKVKKLEEEKATQEKSIQEAKEREEKLKLDSHIEKKLSQIKDDEMRESVRASMTGKSIEEVDKQFDNQVKALKKIEERFGKKDSLVINPIDSKKEIKFKDLNEALVSSEIPKDEKKKFILEKLMK